MLPLRVQSPIQSSESERNINLDQQTQLDPHGEVIALFDAANRLVVFNQQFCQNWGLHSNWLKQKPHYEEVFAEIVKQGYWSQTEYAQFLSAITSPETIFPIYIEQTNGKSIEAYCSNTSDTGSVITFLDITEHRRSQAHLSAELKRQAFLLGLMERIQPASELQEIGQFALSYLVQAMGAAFGDVKVIFGKGQEALAHVLTNEISGQFVATYGEAVAAEMTKLLDRGIPYGQGLLWQVVETATPLFVEDYYKHSKAVTAFRHPGIGQLGIFPIPAADSTIIGVLTLESRSLRKLQDAPQQDMLMAACRMLGVAIERAQAQERLRQINKDLEQASQLKSEFLASMSHELRTPLNSILGFSDLLLRQDLVPLSSRQTKYLRVIEESGQHLLQLINDILDLSKIESGKAELELQPVSIPDLCLQCQEMIQPRVNKKRLQLSLNFDNRLKQANLDERRVRQILINLLSNAVKFTPEGGHIKLSCRIAYGNELQSEIYRPDCSPVNLSTPYVCIAVEDTGIGIPQDKWHLLFRPFQQVDASLTRQHEGTGLGLALTKRLAELHGGTVSLESIENQGSTFRVWLPLTEMRQQLVMQHLNQTEASFTPECAIATGEGKWIWVVEDQPYNQALIIEMLELQGYRVELIADGRAMMEVIHLYAASAKALPDLILMDIQLPKVDGFKLIRQLKSSPYWQSVPVVALTAMAMTGDRDRCLGAGADAYLSKPLSLTNLQNTLQALIKA
ncbi:ATP-binding protein [Chroogloeocystis siderophila]|uniref:Circadian input-output histidine kinase CikA n=1 Tax=Chroogloeocystis siderophila 5.2 s.c.1 TaxID=247279 RepID=A0A1U7HEF9_9CHRO|nr:ATP-binding protein [Chroogloeocystis siderophila]OKH21960.1 histidine kinase [Chroogloeocystis siderophila 5.2 s.c.1]